MGKKAQILFVCTGNTCRSPMAAAVYNDRFAGEDSIAHSAGLAADGSGIHPYARDALKRAGISSVKEMPYIHHVSHTVTEKDMEQATLVIAMNGEQAAVLSSAYPAFAAKITVMAEDIPDPWGGSPAVYEQCLQRISTALRKMFAGTASCAGDDPC